MKLLNRCLICACALLPIVAFAATTFTPPLELELFSVHQNINDLGGGWSTYSYQSFAWTVPLTSWTYSGSQQYSGTYGKAKVAGTVYGYIYAQNSADGTSPTSG